MFGSGSGPSNVLISAPGLDMDVPPHVQSAMEKLRQSLVRFDSCLKIDDWPNAKILLTQSFRSILLIANWSLAVQFTGGSSTQVAGLMSIQAFTYEAIAWIIHSLRGKKRHISHYLGDAVLGGMVLFPVAKMYFVGAELTEQLPNKGDWQAMASMATLIAGTCLMTEKAALSYLKPLHDSVTRLFAPQAYALNSRVGENEPLLPVDNQTARILPFLQAVMEEGNFNETFLFLVIWTFAFMPFAEFGNAISDEKSLLHMPSDTADFSVAMQVCGGSFIASWLFALLKYMWVRQCKSWGSISDRAEM